MTLIKKGFNAYKRKGLFAILTYANSRIFTKIFGLPFKHIGVYNGVAVRNVPLFEKIDVFPDHEKELIAAIKKYVVSGEKAVVIGGGQGASSVVTAHQVGQLGKVITFEAGKMQVEKIQETVKLNKVEDIINIRHAIVEKPIHITGNEENASLVLTDNIHNIGFVVYKCKHQSQ